MRPGENKQTRNLAGRAWRVLALGSGALLAGYGVIAATAWARFGGAHTRRPESVDAMLDRFMPTYDVVERHEVEIDAPAAIVLAAAKTQKLNRLPLVRGIFAMRQLVMRGTERQDLPAELVPQVLALGWRVLDEVPDREDRDRLGHPAVAGERCLRRHRRGRLRRVRHARLRQDRVVPAG